MFEQLTKRLDEIFYSLRRRGKLSEKDVDGAMREIRLALLEADVQYAVVRDFVSRVKERAVGQEVSKALNPGQQVVKIVYDELIELLGEPAPLVSSSDSPLVILLAGLQGSGKTTAAGKLARLLKKRGEQVLLVAADLVSKAGQLARDAYHAQLDLVIQAGAGDVDDSPQRHLQVLGQPLGDDYRVLLGHDAIERFGTAAQELDRQQWAVIDETHAGFSRWKGICETWLRRKCVKTRVDSPRFQGTITLELN